MSKIEQHLSEQAQKEYIEKMQADPEPKYVMAFTSHHEAQAIHEDAFARGIGTYVRIKLVDGIKQFVVEPKPGVDEKKWKEFLDFRGKIINDRSIGKDSPIKYSIFPAKKEPTESLFDGDEEVEVGL